MPSPIPGLKPGAIDILSQKDKKRYNFIKPISPTMTKILLTGGSGFLGAHLAKRLSRSYQVYVTLFRSPLPSGILDTRYGIRDAGSEKPASGIRNQESGIWHPVSGISLDITNQHDVWATINNLLPSLIIHTAANTNLRDCEENREAAWQLNVEGTRNLAEAAKEIGARFIYLSTDSVFDGNSQYYKETDKADPINVYGLTKLEGETVVSDLLSDYVILRLALLYGWSLTKSTSFTEDLINELSAGKTINAFTDEYRNPLHVLNLCEIIEEIIQNKYIQGLYHAAGPNRINRYEQALKVADIFGLNKANIQPITTSEISLTYPRPKDCSLNTEKLRSIIKTRIWGLEEGLREMRDSSLR